MKLRLVCAVFVILMIILAWDNLRTESKKAEDEYNDALNVVHEQVRLGINEKAYASYNKALEIRESFDLRYEMVNFLHDVGAKKSFDKELKKLIEMYPKEPMTYERACENAVEMGDIASVYSYRTQLQARKLRSEKIDALCEEHKYDYRISKTGYLKIDPFYFGYARIYSNENYIGFIDSYGNQCIGAKYSVAAPYGGTNLFMVKDENNQAIYLDMAGEKTHVDPEQRNMIFDDIGCYCNNMIPVCENGKYRYIDYGYNDIDAEKLYEYAGAFNENRAAAKIDDGWILLDEKLNQVGGKVFEEIKMTENAIAMIGGHTVVKQNGLWYLADINGELIGNEGYEEMCFPCDYGGQQPVAVMKNGKWGFIDVNGNMVFEYQYDNARSFCRGFAAVEINGLWTLIDLDGKQIMEPRFKGMYEMSSSGTVPVLEDNGWNILSFYSMS